MNNIPVVYASDNNYVLPTVVSITSLLANKNQDTFYHIFILENKISDENKKTFCWVKYENEYTIEFIPIQLDKLEQWKGNGNWPITTFGRFFVCDLLSKYDKCIYLDGDTVILDDLNELYKTDLTNTYLGAVKEPGTNYNVAANKHDFLSKAGETYFLKCINAGVLVMNLKSLRYDGGGQYLQNKTFEISRSLDKGKIVTDQDILNMLFVGKIKYIDLKYNFYINNILNFYDRHYYPFCFSRDIIEDAFSHPVIIHYALPEKPWIYSNAKMVYAWPYKFSAALWRSYYVKSPLGIYKLKQKRLNLLLIIWYYIKPLLKKSKTLIKIKRYITKTAFDSPYHDFFD